MALSDVTFEKGKGGLGRPLAGEDHISGMVFYSASIPSGFASQNIQTVYSIEGAEALGIADTTVIWYHINEFFRIQPKGVLHVGIFAVPTLAHDFAEVETLQTSTLGKIRQMGVFTPKNFDDDQVGLLNAIAEDLSDVHKPLSIIFAANNKSYAAVDPAPAYTAVALSALPDLRALDMPYVSVVIGEDGNAKGKALTTSTGRSVSCLGAVLGAVSASKVSESIAWVKKFNVANTELDVIAFTNGVLYKDVEESLLNELNDKGYIFLRKHIGINGSYFNDSNTSAAEDSDYAMIENNRTIDKAIRNIRTFMVPELNGPLFVTDDGKLTEDTIAYFTSVTSRPLEQMQRDGELSAFEVIINAEQDILSDSTLDISVKLVPVGVARQIKINIGFTVKLS